MNLKHLPISEPFFALTPSVVAMLLEKQLTEPQLRLWLYLTQFDKFGDRFVKLPTVKRICQECHISKTSFYRAIARLEELELFEFKTGSVSCRNLQAPKSYSYEPNYLSQNNSLSSGTIVPLEGLFSDESTARETTSIYPKNIDQTYTKTEKVVSINAYSVEEDEDEDEEEESERSFAGSKEESKSVAQEVKVAHEDNIPPPPPKNIASEVDGWLSNRVFIQWWASRVEKTDFGSKQLEMPPTAYVRQRIRNLVRKGNLDAVRDMYESFLDECDRHLDNYQQSVAAGIKIDDEYQERIASIAPQLQPVQTKALPQQPRDENSQLYVVRTADEWAQSSKPPEGWNPFALVKDKSMTSASPSEKQKEYVIDAEYLEQQRKEALARFTATEQPESRD